MVDVKCPVCGTSFELGDETLEHVSPKHGTYYLIPKSSATSPVQQRLDLLKYAGVNVDKLEEIMSKNTDVKDLFEDNDSILNTLKNGNFIDNPELFRRWITVQTFRLLKDTNGWNHAVRSRYNLRYVFKQTVRELELLVHLKNKLKSTNDKRFQFFTFDDLKFIFYDLMEHSTVCNKDLKEKQLNRIIDSEDYDELLKVIRGIPHWHFAQKGNLPTRWMNCFKGAGAYYTLLNLIYTHGLILESSSTMQGSLNMVDKLFNQIISYNPASRRWDMLMSLLIRNVKNQKFELTF